MDQLPFLPVFSMLLLYPEWAAQQMGRNLGRRTVKVCAPAQVVRFIIFQSRPGPPDFVLYVVLHDMLFLFSPRRVGWEHISQFIAQATRAKDPFTKEDCIAKYQQLHAAPAGPQKKVVAPAVPAAAPPSTKSAPERPSRREPRVRERERERKRGREEEKDVQAYSYLLHDVLHNVKWCVNVFLSRSSTLLFCFRSVPLEMLNAEGFFF